MQKEKKMQFDMDQSNADEKPVTANLTVDL